MLYDTSFDIQQKLKGTMLFMDTHKHPTHIRIYVCIHMLHMYVYYICIHTLHIYNMHVRIIKSGIISSKFKSAYFESKNKEQFSPFILLHFTS